MRNIPFAFLNEDTIAQIDIAEQEYAKRHSVDAFAHLAETQASMRGVIAWPALCSGINWAAKRMVATLEKMMEMSGPNSIANLERALQRREPVSRLVE